MLIICYNSCCLAMEEDVKAFLDYLAREKKYSSNTLAAYQSDLAQLTAYVKSSSSGGGISTSQLLNTELLSGYMYDLREKKYAQSTVARKVAAAKSFLKYMLDTGKLRSDLTPNLASPQVNKPLPKPLSVSEVRRFLAEPAKLSSIEAKRDRSMLELLYATGLRASELMALNVDDVDLRVNKVRCQGGKAGVRVVPIDGYVAQMIKEYVSEIRPRLVNNEAEIALFPNRRGDRLTRQGFWQIIQGYADKAGLRGKVTPRSLRHSFAAHKISSGADMHSVQELLGHTHLSTTKVYQDVKI
jgi:integrase/recombinase XerD